ncbi:hypothetical protein ACFLZW_02595 [Chloroflexota bacterium]
MKGKLLQIILIALGAAVGFILARAFLDMWARGRLYQWHQANLPSQSKAAHFLPVSDDYLYLQSMDGRFYAYGLAPKLEENWREIEPNLVGELRRLGKSDCVLVEGPWRPAIQSASPVVEGVECGFWTSSGSFNKYSFAILENGEVWRWQQASVRVEISLASLIFMLIGIIVGMFAGGLTAGLVSRGLDRRSQRQTEGQKVPVTLDVEQVVQVPALTEQTPAVLPQIKRQGVQFTCPECRQIGFGHPLGGPVHCDYCGFSPVIPIRYDPVTNPAPVWVASCPHCGVKIGREMLTGPVHGRQDCPFNLTREHATNGLAFSRMAGWLYIGLGAAALGAMIITGPLALFFGPAAAIFLFIGLSVTFGRRQTLHNPLSGAMYQRHSVFGLEMDEKLVLGILAPKIEWDSKICFTIPPSIAALFITSPLRWRGRQRPHERAAYDLLAYSLIGLLVQGALELRFSSAKRSYLRIFPFQKDEWLLVPGKVGGAVGVDAFLERRILQIVYHERPYYSAQGLPVGDLARRVFGLQKRWARPGNWIVRQVQNEALKRGLVEKQGGLRSSKVRPKAVQQEPIDNQAGLLKTLAQELFNQYPSLRQALQTEIPQGFRRPQPKAGAY